MNREGREGGDEGEEGKRETEAGREGGGGECGAVRCEKNRWRTRRDTLQMGRGGGHAKFQGRYWRKEKKKKNGSVGSKRKKNPREADCPQLSLALAPALALALVNGWLKQGVCYVSAA